MADRIYLDHAATSPLRPEARAAMDEGLRLWANPSSPHAEGRKARAALEDAREAIKAALNWQGEVIFTSGASEGLDIALRRTKAGARLVSAVEHDAVLQAAPDAERLGVNSDGSIAPDLLAEAVPRERPLVAVQQVNSETGNCPDLIAISAIVAKAGGVLLADCAQGAGKRALPPCDMAVISAHKFGGPIGIGALLIRDFALLEPSGGHERGYRQGTENLPGALGMAAAVEASIAAPLPSAEVQAALDGLAAMVRDKGGVWLSDRLASPCGYIHALAMPEMSGSAQVMRLDMAGFAVSQGSACSSGTMKPSRVLTAMALDKTLAANMIRISIGWDTAPEHIDRFAQAWAKLA